MTCSAMLGVLLATLSYYRMLLPSELAIHVGVLGVRTVYCYQDCLLPSRMATLIGRQSAGLLESFCLAMEVWGAHPRKWVIFSFDTCYVCFR